MKTTRLDRRMCKRRRVQPICLEFYRWGRSRACRFLTREGDLFGCKGGGIHPSWAERESKDNPGTYLATQKQLFRYRNHKVWACHFFVIGWVLVIVRIGAGIISWLAGIFEKLTKKS